MAKSIRKIGRSLDQVKKACINISVINSGRGYHVKHTKKVPSIKEIANVIKECRKNLFNNELDFFIEPGRGVIGNAGKLVGTVIGIAIRYEGEWLYLDISVYHVLQENIEGIMYEIHTEKIVKKQ